MTENKKLNKIELTKNTIADAISHQNGKNPVNIEMLFNAPELFKNAIILNYTENFKNRGYDSYLCACFTIYKKINISLKWW